MANTKVIQPAGWARPKGYSNGIVAEGKMLFIAGQIGWDPTKEDAKVKGDFAVQFDLALSNVVRVLREAGGLPEHLARVTVYVTDKKAYMAATKEVGQSWRKYVGPTYPAMSLVQVADLLEEGALVEIEATAAL
jgi:enamine deaminase RidA (YjgF/YER057c/UK114 family)